MIRITTACPTWGGSVRAKPAKLRERDYTCDELLKLGHSCAVCKRSHECGGLGRFYICSFYVPYWVQHYFWELEKAK